MLLLAHRWNKICKMSDEEGKDLRSCFFPSIINSDNVANLALDSHKHYCTLCWDFFMRSRKIFVRTVICFKYRCNFLLTFGKKKLCKTAHITQRRTSLSLLVSYQAGKLLTWLSLMVFLYHCRCHFIISM